MSSEANKSRVPVWSSRPAIGPYITIYAILSLFAALILVILEIYANTLFPAISMVAPASLPVDGISIPYPLELATVVVIFIIFLSKSLRLVLLRAKTKYELYSDGLYIDLGIVNLENIFVAPMAFSDARLYRPWSMRVMKLGRIVVDTNDGRHFEMKFVKNPLEVQSMIRATLSHPTFRSQQ
jgi:hypothetical protein